MLLGIENTNTASEQSWGKGRVSLLGDAAQATIPIGKAQSQFCIVEVKIDSCGSRWHTPEQGWGKGRIDFLGDVCMCRHSRWLASPWILFDVVRLLQWIYKQCQSVYHTRPVKSCSRGRATLLEVAAQPRICQSHGHVFAKATHVCESHTDTCVPKLHTQCVSKP